MPPQFDREKPIYLQVVDMLIQEIARGIRKEGEKLPSVRDLAFQLEVNPNTIQRVYRELEHKEITITKRGQGTFVTNDTEKVIALREQLKQQYIEKFIIDMHALGFSKEEIVQTLKGGEDDD
jgi:GntR family transcriptional regulator